MEATMKVAQRQLIDDVRAALGPAAVVTDPSEIAPWLVDWRRRWTGASAAMLEPRSTGEVALMVGRAHTLGVALVPQGGNTSMVGGATPPADGSALILSLRRMNRIRSLERDQPLAVAEAGVILQHFHEATDAIGWRFPLSLGSRGSATIGGLVSTNAGGVQVLRHGTMGALVAGLEAVLPDGSIHDGLAALKKDNRGPDPDGWLIGAEGTLGVVTAASLKLVPRVTEHAVAWVGMANPERALALLRLMEKLSGDAIESFEILPRDSLDAVLGHVAGTRAPLAGPHAWHVLIDYVGADAQERLADLVHRGMERGLVDDAVIATSDAQAEAFWRIRESISEAERAGGPAMQHDISVPVAAMPAFMTRAASVIEASFPGVRASGYGHLGDGNVHFHVRGPIEADPVAWRREIGESASHMVHDLVTAAGGSISAEHGIGQMKLDEFARLGPPSRVALLRAVKGAIDLRGIMNPGKLVPPAGLAPEHDRP